MIAGTNLQIGASYRFLDVTTNVDAIVTIDSLVNGAKVNKIDDNGNGVGYTAAFQPAIQSGNIISLNFNHTGQGGVRPVKVMTSKIS